MKAPISMLELRGGSVKGISVYERIQESKRLGYSKQKTAERLQCCWRTVDKYWDMTFDDYQVIESKVRKESVLEQYDAHDVTTPCRAQLRNTIVIISKCSGAPMRDSQQFT